MEHLLSPETLSRMKVLMVGERASSTRTSPAKAASGRAAPVKTAGKRDSTSKVRPKD
jgi:hypothetical protein